jgi:hypothetical protein
VADETVNRNPSGRLMMMAIEQRIAGRNRWHYEAQGPVGDPGAVRRNCTR